MAGVIGLIVLGVVIAVVLFVVVPVTDAVLDALRGVWATAVKWYGDHLESKWMKL